MGLAEALYCQAKTALNANAIPAQRHRPTDAEAPEEEHGRDPGNRLHQDLTDQEPLRQALQDQLKGVPNL